MSSSYTNSLSPGLPVDRVSSKSSLRYSCPSKYTLTALVIGAVVMAILATLTAALIVGPKRFDIILPLDISITLFSACIVVVVGVGLSKIKKGSRDKPSIVKIQKPITPAGSSLIPQDKLIVKEEPKPAILLRKHNSDPTCHFSALPAELKQHILSYLTLPELLVTSTVSRDYHAQSTEVINSQAREYGWQEGEDVLEKARNYLRQLCAEIKFVISQSSFFLFVQYLDKIQMNLHEESTKNICTYQKIPEIIKKLPLLSKACSKETKNLVSLAFKVALPFCLKDLDHSLKDAILYAVRHANTGLFQEEINTLVLNLLKRGANPNISSSFTPLMHYATSHGLDKILYQLLTFNGDPNIQDEDNWTPLTYAIECGASENSILSCVRLLLERGTDPSIPSSEGFTPLHCAARKGYTQIISLLLQNPKAHINSKTSKGYTPISCAIRARYGEQKTLEIVQLFENLKGDLNCQAKSGNTPLHYATWNLYPELVRYLIQRKVSLNALGTIYGINQVTPLHSLFLQVGHLSEEQEKLRSELLGIYLEKGVDLNIQASNGQTVLHAAATCGKREYVKLLLEHGADPTILDNQGHSAYYYAEKAHILDLFPDPPF